MPTLQETFNTMVSNARNQPEVWTYNSGEATSVIQEATSSNRRASMTRKHFEAIAQAVSRVSGFNIREEVVNALIPVLQGFNRAFDPQRFRAACNVPTNYGQRINLIGQEDRQRRDEIRAYQAQNPTLLPMEEEIEEFVEAIEVLRFPLTYDEAAGVYRYADGRRCLDVPRGSFDNYGNTSYYTTTPPRDFPSLQ